MQCMACSVAILGASSPPPLPQPLSTPAGAERGAQQPYVANALCGVEFMCNRQRSNLPGTGLPLTLP